MSTTSRLHGLDAVRAGALLLGILLHALLPFTSIRWMINDLHQSWVALIVTGVIHAFRMTVFMVLAGYFGRMVVQRRGARSYLVDRIKRILLPAIVFWPIAVLPLGLLASAAAARRGQSVEMPENESWLLMLTPGQLWFLVTLFYLVVLVLIGRVVGLRILGVPRAEDLVCRVGRALAIPGGWVAPTVIYALALYLQGTPPGAGITAPVTILPELPSTLAYLTAFLVGWFLHASPGALGRLSRWWLPAMVAGLLLSLSSYAALPLIAGSVVSAGASWLLTVAALGIGVRFLNRDHRGIRYLADASYWMYLIHLPLVLAMELFMMDAPWPILVKFTITITVSMAVMLLSYRYLVRGTWLGLWLNGRKLSPSLR